MGAKRTIAAMAMLLGAAAPAAGACTQALAVYSDADKSMTLEFRPNEGEVMTATNLFRVVMENDVVLDGIVQWNMGIARPNGMMMYQCPDGDVTGEELDACIVWSGVVYALDEAGTVDLLPPQTKPAADRLLLPDFGRTLRYSTAFGEGRLQHLPWDVLSLSGCQE